MSISNVQSEDALDAVYQRLEVARSAIEERFLAGGDVLVRANEIVSRLLDSVEGIVTAMDEGHAATATQRLAATVQQLRSLTESEKLQQDGLNGVLQDGNAIGPLITDMQKTLAYLNTCAVATRITSAGMEEFAGFADDILTAVTDASRQVTGFAQRVDQLGSQLRSAQAGGKAAITTFASTIPGVAETLLAASTTIDQRRRDLGKIAAQSAQLALGVRTKVSRVLSALQIGDVTRQRIEHVQSGIRIFQDLARIAAPQEADAARDVVIRLLLAQLGALTSALDDGSRDIIATIEGFGRDADTILSLRGRSNGSDIKGGADTIGAIERGVERTRSLVDEIETASNNASEARTATLETASELLSSMGSIGNLRSVKDDIRCLSINAYLRCYRMGTKGRAVGVIATELSTYAERLGTSAAGVLQRLSKMKDAASMLGFGDGSEHGNLKAELEGAAEALREISLRTDHHLEEMSHYGDAIAQRIGGMAHELDFQSNLTEALVACGDMLKSIDRSALNASLASSLIGSFSTELYQIYTMASERDVHREIIPTIAMTFGNKTESCVDKRDSDQELFEDALF